MKNDIRFVGLDVLAETIAVAVAEADGKVRFLGMIPNRPEAVRRLVARLGPVNRLRFCCEAGPTGYVLYWQLTGLGAHCSRPVVEELGRWIAEASKTTTPKSPLGKALYYAANQWRRLGRFLEDGRLELHNNACERVRIPAHPD